MSVRPFLFQRDRNRVRVGTQQERRLLVTANKDGFLDVVCAKCGQGVWLTGALGSDDRGSQGVRAFEIAHLIRCHGEPAPTPSRSEAYIVTGRDPWFDDVPFPGRA